MKPCFKHIHPVYEVEKGILRVGETLDIAVEMEDEDGSIRFLISLMDGTRTLENIYKEILIQYPHIQFNEIIDAINEFNNIGMLYDYEQEESTKLTERELERYKVNLNYFSLFSNLDLSPRMIQEKLNDAKVTIIGVGAFGCSLLLYLSALGVKQIQIIDDDTIELSNLNRQLIFNESDIGRYKVDVAKEYIAKFHSSTRIEAISKRILSKSDVEAYVTGSDCVLLAADYPKFILQGWVNSVCVQHNIPAIYGGVNLDKGFVYSVIPGKTGCIDCMMLNRAEQAIDFVSILEKYLLLKFQNPSSVTAPNLMMVTGIMATEFQRMVTGVGEKLSAGRILAVDFVTYSTSTIEEWEQNHEKCPTCGIGSHDQPIFKVLAQAEEYLLC
ncbi:ThiF family adenylyltransferase [Bacillus sp. EAC]|uniref:HesA/MoeB/ThiF family protein n=1 Tax=Bacillus sp. EAC TaxID=1978338 RepID=UPI000B42E539|nr:ThiF family adenylyltransferase [Bacillus sp. EAC]